MIYYYYFLLLRTALLVIMDHVSIIIYYDKHSNYILTTDKPIYNLFYYYSPDLDEIQSNHQSSSSSSQSAFSDGDPKSTRLSYSNFSSPIWKIVAFTLNKKEQQLHWIHTPGSNRFASNLVFIFSFASLIISYRIEKQMKWNEINVTLSPHSDDTNRFKFKLAYIRCFVQISELVLMDIALLIVDNLLNKTNQLKYFI